MNEPDLLQTDLLTALGMDTASEAEREDFLHEAGDLILARLARRIEQSLPAPEQERFRELFLNGAPIEERNRFLDERVPELAAFVLEEALRVKQELLQPTTPLEPG